MGGVFILFAGVAWTWGVLFKFHVIRVVNEPHPVRIIIGILAWLLLLSMGLLIIRMAVGCLLGNYGVVFNIKERTATSWRRNILRKKTRTFGFDDFESIE